MRGEWLFLAAYTGSGLAALIYEVVWTRMLTLYMGHTTAASSTVVAAFMGGLAGGAALGGRLAPRLTPRQALYTYAALECVVAVTALIIPWQLETLAPLLGWAYRDGAPSLLFPMVRFLVCLSVLLLPTLALGATFPVAVRWFVHSPEHPGRAGGALYATNTAGAALGALGAGFLLIPAVGIVGATLVGVAADALTILIVLVVASTTTAYAPETPSQERPVARRASGARNRGGPVNSDASRLPDRYWLAATVLALTGFASPMFQVAWTRILSMIMGPSTYAFAAMLTAFIAGLALGSMLGSAVAGRTRRPDLAVALALAGAAVAAAAASSFAGGGLPRLVLDELADSSRPFGQLLVRQWVLAAALIVPTAFGLGVSFPLAFELVGRRDTPIARRLGALYAINTLAFVAGALITGFVAIPVAGLQDTIRMATTALAAAAALVFVRGAVTARVRAFGLVPTLAVMGWLMTSPPWDHELIASGAYKYAPHIPQDLDRETALKAGTLLYYRDGAASTVSVKRLTGDLSLAIDGKVDASTSADMLTQKTLAHLPLLLHSNPQEIAIIGLGSGVTLASALVHPIESVDVIEISPEVVEASRYFAAYNRGALDDPRARLILGDARSHLSLSSRTYDVIISEPSNPWMAGVAALFTEEFFAAVRRHLRADGIFCQWAHTYDISGEDLRSVVATFASVFPQGTMWLVGDEDLLLVGSQDPLDSRLANIERSWGRPGVAPDLSEVSAQEPFALLSLFIGGPAEVRRYATGAVLQNDNRMALEFSGRRALNTTEADANVLQLRQLLQGQQAPPPIERALATAGAREWRNRGAAMIQANAYDQAYQNHATALKLDPADAGALTGIVRAAVASHRESDAVALLRSLASAHPQAPGLWIALSKLRAADSAFDEAIAEAKEACAIAPLDPAGWEQLASLYSDLGDADRLAPVADTLRRMFPERAGAFYYSAASQFLRGQFPAALELARRTIALDSRYPSAHNLLGAIHATVGETQAAREAFQTALRFDPRDSATYTNLGLLELASGDRTAAANFFSEALSLDPDSTAARLGLAQTR